MPEAGCGMTSESRRTARAGFGPQRAAMGRPPDPPSASRARDSLHPGPDAWGLAPEGAAVHAGARTAVIADVHLGYEWARAAGGDCLPAHSLDETLRKLACLLARAGEAIDRLVVAGDL